VAWDSRSEDAAVMGEGESGASWKGSVCGAAGFSDVGTGVYMSEWAFHDERRVGVEVFASGAARAVESVGSMAAVGFVLPAGRACEVVADRDPTVVVGLCRKKCGEAGE
jgi:hypothetical protein